MASNVFGAKVFRPTAPDKGSFPLDHDGECKVKFHLIKIYIFFIFDLILLINYCISIETISYTEFITCNMLYLENN